MTALILRLPSLTAAQVNRTHKADALIVLLGITVLKINFMQFSAR